MSKYWFRKRQGLFSKDGGWGWVPISWEGWLIVAGFVSLMITNAVIFTLTMEIERTPLQFIKFIAVIAGLIALVAYISHLKTRP